MGGGVSGVAVEASWPWSGLEVEQDSIDVITHMRLARCGLSAHLDVLDVMTSFGSPTSPRRCPQKRFQTKEILFTPLLLLPPPRAPLAM